MVTSISTCKRTVHVQIQYVTSNAWSYHVLASFCEKFFLLFQASLGLLFFLFLLLFSSLSFQILKADGQLPGFGPVWVYHGQKDVIVTIYNLQVNRLGLGKMSLSTFKVWSGIQFTCPTVPNQNSYLCLILDRRRYFPRQIVLHVFYDLL